MKKKNKKEKARDNKRVCGIKLWWILLGTAFISILLSIVLGVTLGMVLKQQKRKDDSPQSDSYDLGFPRGDFLVPLKLVGQSRTCLADSSTLPGLVGPIEKVLWSCDLPRHQLHFDIKSKDSGWSSFPPALPAQQGTAEEEESEVVISSIGGKPNPKGSIMPQALYEGIQPPTFFHQPLYRVLDIGDSTKSKHFKKKRDSEGSSPKYNFRVLYTKRIVLRLITITRLLSNPEYLDGHALDMALDSSEIGSEEVVWLCEWDKTYLEGRVWMEGTDSAGFRMVLDEKRPTSFEFEQLFPGSNTADGKGKITCRQKKSNGRGDLVDLAVGNTGSNVNLSSEINTAKQISERGERKIVEEIVRDTFEGRKRTRKRSSEVSYPTERVEGDSACSCSWIAN